MIPARWPREDALLERGKARELLPEKVAHPAEDDLALRQERADLAVEQVDDRPRDDLQG